jgi:hypothetical protein
VDAKTHLESGQAREDSSRSSVNRSSVTGWVIAGLATAAIGFGWFVHSRGESASSADTRPSALPQVTVSEPLMRKLDTRLGFLGQFSAVDQVEAAVLAR